MPWDVNACCNRYFYAHVLLALSDITGTMKDSVRCNAGISGILHNMANLNTLMLDHSTGTSVSRQGLVSVPQYST